MNLVLYSTVDLSPITILDVPMWAIDMLEARCHVRFQVVGSVMPFVPGMTMHDEFQTHKLVQVWAEPIWRKDQKSLMLFTDMEIEALQLEPGYLPGQVHKIQRLEKANAFLRSLLFALGGDS